MLHDAAEHVTGDIPAPIKWAYPHLDDALDTVEQDFFETHGIDQYLTESETKLLKWADMMELVMFAKSEVHMGNLHMFPIFRRGKAYLEALPFPTEQARQLFEKEATNVQNHS
jgi:5'-deoxynucleotidase YfbR-like HD superfamily hydrolase